MNVKTDDLHPLDPGDGAAQLALLQTLVTCPDRVADLGAGAGRLARPLADAGCDVLAVDSDPSAHVAGAWAPQPGIELLEEDIVGEGATWFTRGPFDAVLCLGNTLALFLDEEQVALLFARIADGLRPGGLFLIDDFPVWGWEAVEAGDWPTGVTEDGEAQLIWVPGKPIFAFRTGREVAPECDDPLPGERLLRLWSIPELTDLAEAHGLSIPLHRPEGGLVQFVRT